MTVIPVNLKDTDADYTYLTLEQIASADFYTNRAMNDALVTVHMADGNTYTVQGQQAFFLQEALKLQGEAHQRPNAY